MEAKTPVILSADKEVKQTFRSMIEQTTDAIITSFDDNAAYSGKNVYELRSQIQDLGFLPEHGTGFEESLETVKKTSCRTFFAHGRLFTCHIFTHLLLPRPLHPS